MDFVVTSPVYPNKWRYFIDPLPECECSDKQFNWFMFGKPIFNGKHQVIELGKYTLFHDKSTGKSYKAKKKCIVKLSGDLDEFNRACNERYDGIVIVKTRKPLCDLVCSEVEIVFKTDVVEESKVDFSKRNT